MITKDTPIGTRVFRNYDGKIGTVVSIREYRPDGGADVGSVSVCLDSDLTVWSGTFEAWDLADGDLDEPDRVSGDDLARLALDALSETRSFTREECRFIYGRRDDQPVDTASPAVQAFWRAFYDRLG